MLSQLKEVKKTRCHVCSSVDGRKLCSQCVKLRPRSWERVGRLHVPGNVKRHRPASLRPNLGGSQRLFTERWNFRAAQNIIIKTPKCKHRTSYNKSKILNQHRTEHLLRLGFLQQVSNILVSKVLVNEAENEAGTCLTFCLNLFKPQLWTPKFYMKTKCDHVMNLRSHFPH